jgi:hypothetical protein
MAKTSAGVIQQVEGYGGLGLEPLQIALLLDVPRTKRDSWVARTDIIEAIARGKIRTTARVSKAALDVAVAGDPSMLKFWLKAQAKWSDEAPKDTVQVVGDNVKVYLPDNGR